MSPKSKTPKTSFEARTLLIKNTNDVSSDDVHIIREGVCCDTERRGYATPRNLSPTKIVVDGTEGFVPLWAEGVVLRWRFRERSMQVFADPQAAQDAIEQLFAEAVLAWGDASPVRFKKQDDAWDFEIAMRSRDECSVDGCVVASAFFPDAGQHALELYPKLFQQSAKEQLETMIHEIGHVFGLRHFFAQDLENSWPSEIFGTHSKFSIMNYGGDSKLTAADKKDLKTLYRLAWSGELKDVNGTPIRLVEPFHMTGIDPNPAFILRPVNA